MSIDIELPRLQPNGPEFAGSYEPALGGNFEYSLDADRPVEVEDLYAPVIPLGGIDLKKIDDHVQKVMPQMIEVADLSRLWAGSHRGFLVGACGYAVSTDPSTGISRAALVWGANYTPYPGAPKSCAEKNVIAKTKAIKFDYLAAMAIWGPSEFGDVYDVPTETLHPCSDYCQKIIRAELDGVIRQDTVFVTTNDTGAREELYPDDFFRIHQHPGN